MSIKISKRPAKMFDMKKHQNAENDSRPSFCSTELPPMVHVAAMFCKSSPNVEKIKTLHKSPILKRSCKII
jgi:hypothetical protein